MRFLLFDVGVYVGVAGGNLWLGITAPFVLRFCYATPGTDIGDHAASRERAASTFAEHMGTTCNR